jgi:hypothetical protein
MFVCIVIALAVLFTLAPLCNVACARPLDERGVAKLRRSLKPVLSLSETELVALVPERSGLYFIGCPNCDGGTQENQISWSIDRPDVVFCRFCDHVYPSEQYPDDKVQRVPNPAGGVHEYPYWEAPEPAGRALRSSVAKYDPRSGYRHFFQAKGWFLARKYLADAAEDLAKLYEATGDRAFSRRSALLLNRFAEVYPGYCVHYDLPFQEKIIFPRSQGVPYPVEDFRAAKWDWWAYMDIPADLIRAYDHVRDSGDLTPDMVERIENDLFRGSVAFTRSVPAALTNMDPTLLRGLITAGMVLNEPEYIHDAVDRIRRLVAGQFFADGFWREGALSYHNQTVNGLISLANLLEGYSDPEGYVDQRDGEHFQHLDLRSLLPILKKAEQIPRLMRYPSGRVVATHDTWAREQREPLDSSGPMLLRAAGQGRLGRGTGPDQAQVHLHFSGGYGHQHADLLSMTLFAKGQERLSDIGYSHTRHRAWTVGTLAHNTVVVDGQDQAMGWRDNYVDGNLHLYVPGDETFQAIEASGERGYADVTSVYRRRLIQIGVGLHDAYVVDLFQVTGGDRHEYVLVGDANNDGVLRTDLDTQPAGETLLPAGVTATLPTGESVRGSAEGHNLGYAFIRNVRRAQPSGPWQVDITSDGEPAGAVRVHGLTDAKGVLYLADVPSLRRAEEDDARVDDFTMPALVNRIEGSGLATSFVTVLEPYAREPFLTSASRLPLDEGGAGSVALRIEHAEGTDLLLLAPGNGGTVRSGNASMTGRIGLIRERNGRVARMTLVGGTELSKGNDRIEGKGTLEGQVVGVLRKERGGRVDGLILNSALPDTADLAGLTAIVIDGAGFTCGHQIVAADSDGGQPVLVLADDPGFETDADGASRHTFFPGRTWTGDNRFQIATVSTKLFTQ